MGVQSTEQSVGIIVGAFAPTHKYKCRKVRHFVRVQKCRTFFVAKHTTKRSGGPFLVRENYVGNLRREGKSQSLLFSAG